MPKAPEPKEIRECFSDYENEWKDIRDEAKIDVKYIAGDPWTKEDRAMREDAGRPCISLDELNQYINQYNNSLRQNKRAVQVIPKGSGANDDDASHRENIIRGIENDSNAQESYITMGENAASRSYGFTLLRTEYKDDYREGDEPDESLFERRIVIKRVANPDTILLNPGFEKADASDVEDGFVIRRIKRSVFGKLYPKAEKKSFVREDMRAAKDWIGEKDLQIAEYWKMHKTPKKLLALDGPAGLVTMWESEFKKFGKPEEFKVIDDRMVDIKEVVEYPTNGLEVLDALPWAGSRIPIISCFGKELWMDEGMGAKRHLLSMIRLARDPQMLFAYMCTQEAEEAGMTPKTPFIGAKGQFESARQVWEMINKQPYSFVEYDMVLDSATGQPLPPPSRLAWTPNFEAYEVAKDSVRRSIQAAMGITPLPTAMQRNNEKSGVALEKIETQESIGSFHFSDNFDRALHNLGWQMNEILPIVYDTQRELPIGKPDGSYDTLHVIGNASHPLSEEGTYDVQGLPQTDSGDTVEHLHTGRGDYGVTISTGPSYHSQREQASEFVDHLIANWQQLGIPPAVGVKILALGVKLKGIGPIGDAIRDLLDPPSDMQNWPPAAQAAYSQLQAQLQQLQLENSALLQDKAARVAEQQTKIKIEQMKQEGKGAADAAQHASDVNLAQLANDVKILVAEITAKSQSESERNQMYQEFWMENHKAAHEVGLQATEHEHAKDLTAQQAQHTQDAAAQAASLQPEPEPQGQGQ